MALREVVQHRRRKGEPRSSYATRGLYPRAPHLRSRAGEREQALSLPVSEQSSSSGDMPRRIALPLLGAPRSVLLVRRRLAHACWSSAAQLSTLRVQHGQPLRPARTAVATSPAPSTTTASVRNRDTANRLQARPTDLTWSRLTGLGRGILSPTRYR